jgi:hypothetical protein
MFEAYVIEAGDEAVGIIVREGRRFRFLSSSRRSLVLDGEYYRNPREAERAAAGLLATRSLRSEPSPR